MTIQAPLRLKLINHLGKSQSKDKDKEVVKVQMLLQIEKVHKEKRNLAVFSQLALDSRYLFNNSRK